jgi:alkylhydroperoxidase family enzyme
MVRSRLTPLSLQQLDEASAANMQVGAEIMGFLANDGLTMARVSGLLPALNDLVAATYRPGEVDMDTKRLLALMSSTAAGCVYCQHHNRFGALRAGLPAEQLDSIWDYENAEGFTPAQRVALRVAHHASLQPNQVSDEDFSALREHYPENACAEIVAVIALFGFLNRWNDTIKTEPEELPPPARNRTDKG